MLVTASYQVIVTVLASCQVGGGGVFIISGLLL